MLYIYKPVSYTHLDVYKRQVYTKPSDLEEIRDKLVDHVESADVEMSPSQTVVVDDTKKAQTLLRLIDALDDLDDVVSVTSNYDIPDDILNSLE